MELTASHWIYAVVTVLIIITMLFRRGVVIPAILGTFVIGWVYNDSFIKGLQAIFNANMAAAKELFNIFLIITLMTALLNSMRDLGSDKLMVAPVQKVMTNGHVSFFVMIIVTYFISLFFWPTPAVPLVGALLIPAAIRSGLPAMGAGMAIALAGQGMALSSDYIMKVAPGISASAAGVSADVVADRGLVLSLITGGVAIVIAYIMISKTIRKAGHEDIQKELDILEKMQAGDEAAAAATRSPWTKPFAIIVPLAMLFIMIYMIATKVSDSLPGMEGGDGAAFIGGVAALLLIFGTFVFRKAEAFDYVGEHITAGFVFAFKAMGTVVPIAGFFFLGSDGFVESIIGASADGTKPAFLFEVISQFNIPDFGILAAILVTVIGVITGLDGSGFSGLPLTGSISAGITTNDSDAATLAALGQMGAIWGGGGTIVAWSSLVAVAGFAGVSAMELARKNMIPVLSGLLVAAILAVVIW